jgi:hypothetical protein
MIHPMISPRTRSSSAATQPGQRPAPAAAAAALTTRRPARLRTVTAEGPAMPNACARRSGGARSSVGRGAFVSWAGRVCQLGGARSSVGRGAFVSWAGRVRQLRGGRPLRRTVGTVRSAAGELRYAAAAGVLALPLTVIRPRKHRRATRNHGGGAGAGAAAPLSSPAARVRTAGHTPGLQLMSPPACKLLRPRRRQFVS